MKSVYGRSGLLVGLSGAVASLCFFLPESKTSNETGIVLQLPEKLEGYDSVSVEMSQKEKDWLPSSTRSQKRCYFPHGSSPETLAAVQVSLILSGGDERSLHRPEVCMDGQGWSIPTKVVRSLELDGKQVEVMDLFLKRVVNGRVVEAHYYFFWVGRGISTPSYREMKWLSLVDNFTKNRNHRWAYPGVFLWVNPHAPQPQKDAWFRAQHVLKQVIPSFHKQFGAEENL